VQGNYQLTSQSQVKDDSLLILHFILASLSPAGNPAVLMNEMLKGFLSGEAEYQYREIRFDFSDDSLLASHDQTLKKLLFEVEKYPPPTSFANFC
jgi:hypothetical protein